MTILLDMLEENDFYVRFHVVTLLSMLVLNNTPHLQECILTSPMGMSRLMALLDDRREIIRNGRRSLVHLEGASSWLCFLDAHPPPLLCCISSARIEGLLLLISLTESNADLQKIVAFENAFERLLAIIDEEGAISGGIIVQDCLQLVQNLLRHNVSNQVRYHKLFNSYLVTVFFLIPPVSANSVCISFNLQNYFRETSCIQRIPALFENEATDDRGIQDATLTDSWSDQKGNNMIMVLELIRVLVVPDHSNTLPNQVTISVNDPHKLTTRAQYERELIAIHTFSHASFVYP